MARPFRRLTSDDLRDPPDYRRRFELIDGGLAELPAPPTISRVISYVRRGLMDRHVVEHELGMVLGAPVDIKLDQYQFNGVQPDLGFVAAGRPSVVGRGFIYGAPDLVVEILSPSTSRHDRQTKRER